MVGFLKSVKGKIILAAAVLAAAAAVLLIFLFNGSGGYRSISIAELFGSVLAENNGNEYKAYKNMRLADGYFLTTDADSYTRMLLDDDKYVKLEEQSRACFEKVGSDSSRRTGIRLERGALTAEITKPLSENEDFVVNTPNAVLAVRGTYFRVEVKFEENGDAYCNVWVYGGEVVCNRIMPDGTEILEKVSIKAGYKAVVRMDEIITEYVEERIEKGVDNVDPIVPDAIADDEVVDLYSSSMNGHKLFLDNGELWDIIEQREIDIDNYHSIYSGGKIPRFDERDKENSDSASSNSGSSSESSSSESSSSESSSSESSSSESSSSESSSSESSSSESSSSESSSSESSSIESSSIESSSIESSSIESSSIESSSIESSSSESSSSESSSSESSSSESSSSESSSSESSSSESSSSESSSSESSSSESSSSEGSGGSSGGGSVHTHSFGEFISDNNATCTEDGTKTAVCSVCGAKRTVPDTGSAKGHTTEEHIVPATFTEEGSRTVVCTVCGEVIEKTVLPKLTAPAGIAVDAENFPDEVFRGYVSAYFDTDKNGYLSDEEIAAVTSISVAGTSAADGGVTSLKGVEHFTSLTDLDCDYNSGLSSLDVSENAALRFLHCANTGISSLDVSNNFDLRYLYCQNTGISSLDVSNNTALTALWCDNTNIPFVDLTQNGSLTSFSCSDCKYIIPSNAVSFNSSAITGFDPSKVSNVNNAVFDSTTGVFSNITDDVTYSYDCGNGHFVTFTLSRTGEAIEGVAVDGENFPDEVFRGYVSDNFDTDKDGYLSDEEIAGVTSIYVGGTSLTDDGGVTSLDGVELFTNLTELNCAYNAGLTSFDVRGNAALTHLDCSFTGITSLDVSCNTALEDLYCGTNSLSNLDLSKNTALKTLSCMRTQILNLDVSQNTALEYLACGHNGYISNVDVSKNSALKTLIVCNTKITAIDVRNNVFLESLDCYNTNVPFVDLTNNINISTFNCSMCGYPIPSNALTFDTKTIPGFDPSRVSETANADFDASTGVFSNITDKVSYTYDCGNGHSATFWLSRTGEAIDLGAAVDETNFPDEVFRGYVSDNFDTDNDGYLSQAECDAVTSIDVSGSYSADGGITSLVGIEHFSCLEELDCFCNNGLTELDVSNNTVLDNLYCYNTQITALDVSKNTVLTCLWCDDTQITALDVSKNTALIYLHCGYSELAFIDVGGNSNLTDFNASGNNHPITVTDGTFDLNSIEGFDISRIVAGSLTGATMDENGVLSGITEGTNITYIYDIKGTGESNYRVKFTLVPDENSTFATAGIAVDAENFPDEVFRGYVSDNFDTDNNGYLSDEEIAAVTMLSVSGTSAADGGVISLNGVELFTNLTELNCAYNAGLTSLDVSGNTALTSLYCHYTGITELDVSGNAALEYLWLYNTGITSLDVSQNAALINLHCGDTGVDSLDVSQNTALQYLYCSNTNISSLDVSNNADLTVLNCSNTALSSLDVSHNAALTDLRCFNTNILNLNVSGNANLTYLDCSDTGITTLVVNLNTALTRLECDGTGITELDVNSCAALTYLQCSNTGITELDVSHNAALTSLYCNNTQITELDVSNNTALNALYCRNTQITSLDVSKNTALAWLHCPITRLAYIDVGGNSNLTNFNAAGNNHPITVTDGTFDLNSIEGFDISRIVAGSLTGATMDENGVLSGITEGTNITYIYDCDGKGGHNEIFTLSRTGEPIVTSVAIDSTNFPDDVFRAYVSTNFDTDNDVALSQAERDAATTIDVAGTSSTDGGVTSMAGVEYFGNLQKLYCYYNSGLTELDVSENTALTDLACPNTGITSLDVSNNTALTRLNCYNTGITSFDISTNRALGYLDCSNTIITSLDVSNNTVLTVLKCEYTGITLLDVNHNAALETLYCHNTGITSLDVSQNAALTELRCDYTGITSLDVSNNTDLKYLNCSSTDITSLDVSNNTTLNTMYCSNTGITSLDVSQNVALTGLDCHSTGITSLDVSKNTVLQNLCCNNNQIAELDVSKNTALNTLYCFYTYITELDVSKNTALKHLYCYNTQISSLDVSNNTALDTLYCYNTNIPFVDLTNNGSLTTFTCSGCKYPIPSGATEFDSKTIAGFDPSKVSDVANADFDTSTGVFSNITADVTYTYDCGNGYSATFTLVRTS